MKITCSHYTLKSISGGRDRSGALLRVEFGDGSRGFGDCHPWHELGDAPLSEQLTLLAKGFTTYLTERSLYFARCDARARQKGVSLFQGLTIPPSHHLVVDVKEWSKSLLQQEIERGVTRLKVKLGSDLPSEASGLKELMEWLPAGVHARLDFNQKMTCSTFCGFLKFIEPFLPRIEFIEDPFPFDRELWKRLQQQHAVILAADRESARGLGERETARVLVVKPAIQDCERFSERVRMGDRRLVVTSYLDHPLGQLGAAYEAARIAQAHPDVLLTCGLLAHRTYKTNAFSEQLAGFGPFLQPPSGTGFGFDDLLENQQWEPLQ